MNEIIAKKVTLIAKDGKRSDFTHVTEIQHGNHMIMIHGETDDVDGTRCNVVDPYEIRNLHIMIVEFYKPNE